MTVAAITAPTREEAVEHLRRTSQRTRFWVAYTRIVNHLKKRPSDPNEKYPWTAEHIEKGILERPYISYLMKSGFIQSDVDITVLADFSMMGMRHNKLPIEDLNNLSQIFAKYRASKDEADNGVDNVESIDGPVHTKADICENTSINNGSSNSSNNNNNNNNNNNAKSNNNRLHAFLVGQACHWISIICNKVEDHVEILVFDSRNHNLLTSTPEDFQRILDKHKTVPDWKREIYLCSLQEPQLTARLFHDSVMGVHDIITRLLEHNMEGFLCSFEEHVEKSELNDVWIVPFISWLEVYWPPPVVEANIVKVLEAVGVSKLSPATRQKFMRMVKKIRESVDFGGCGVPVVQRFEAVVLWMEGAFAK